MKRKQPSPHVGAYAGAVERSLVLGTSALVRPRAPCGTRVHNAVPTRDLTLERLATTAAAGDDNDAEVWDAHAGELGATRGRGPIPPRGPRRLLAAQRGCSRAPGAMRAKGHHRASPGCNSRRQACSAAFGAPSTIGVVSVCLFRLNNGSTGAGGATPFKSGVLGVRKLPFQNDATFVSV